MKKIIKIGISLYMGFLFLSCSDNLFIESQSLSAISINSQNNSRIEELFSKLNELNYAFDIDYSSSNVSKWKMLHHEDAEIPIDNWQIADMKNAKGWQIASMDALGAAAGASGGGAWGTIFGPIGITTGAVIGSIVVGGITSIAEVVKFKGDSNMIVNNSQFIFNSLPFIENSIYPCNNIYKGMDIGIYHNYLISKF